MHENQRGPDFPKWQERVTKHHAFAQPSSHRNLQCVEQFCQFIADPDCVPLLTEAEIVLLLDKEHDANHEVVSVEKALVLNPNVRVASWR